MGRFAVYLHDGAVFMAILIDRLRPYDHRPMGHDEWCHMASDRSFEELHAFAERLGIPRRAFQGDHYDVPRHLRAQAIELGAQEVTSKEIVLRMVRSEWRRWRVRGI